MTSRSLRSAQTRERLLLMLSIRARALEIGRKLRQQRAWSLLLRLCSSSYLRWPSRGLHSDALVVGVPYSKALVSSSRAVSPQAYACGEQKPTSVRRKLGSARALEVRIRWALLACWRKCRRPAHRRAVQRVLRVRHRACGGRAKCATHAPGSPRLPRS
ncbi:hypothetical protein DMC30DRAFT_71059 [Rhodotorula diobovata]|uniref:Uncharacterized protein n=1 Tax=Rhodotorula diobovata TaxID=5288 RepID=A0A5C5FMW1_9BASI|nr:hypothetical protein DMC30DRAFT_71059 [Rhodotorula diobovata]